MKTREQTTTGIIKIHPDGFAFVKSDEAEPGEIHIAKDAQAGALDGDKVRVTCWSTPRGMAGRVDEILVRGRTRLIGALNTRGTHKAAGEFMAEDPRIRHRIRLRGGTRGITPGTAVVADIVRYPEHPEDTLEVTVTRVLGERDDPRTEIEKLLVTHDVKDTFPAVVERAAARLPREIQAGDLADRADLRHIPFATIDPETARDFDDAVALEEGPRGGHRLWVAVADVSHYVRPGSPLDREAYQRSFSIYLPNRVIPMLPEHLSAHLCSLLPQTDRLAMVVRIDLDAEGTPLESDFMAAVIHSRARLDYPGVAAALTVGAHDRRKSYAPWLDRLAHMMALARILRARRLAQGALDLDLPEAVVDLDEDDPRRVRNVRRARKDPAEREAYSMIEEFMLAANLAVARSFADRSAPTVWRVHPPPTHERLRQFLDLAASYGIDCDEASLATPRGLRQVLASLRGHPAEKPLAFLLLRSLKQASYETKNVGHFGLAATDYVHFTSPIRRYPDLVVHRLLKARLAAQGKPAGGFSPLQAAGVDVAQLGEIARHASLRERRALEVDREAVDVYRALFMRDRLGDILPGVITAVAGFGVFVQIDDPFIEGLVRVETLPADEYRVDDKTQRLYGIHSGLTLALGQAVVVEVAGVSVQRRKIDLRLHEVPGHNGGDAKVVKRRRSEGRRLEVKRAGKRGAQSGRTRGKPPGRTKKSGVMSKDIRGARKKAGRAQCQRDPARVGAGLTQDDPRRHDERAHDGNRQEHLAA